MTIYFDIPDFPGYKVSCDGKLLRKNGKLCLSKSRQITLYIGDKRIQTSVASLVLRTFVRLPKSGECALHWDDDNTNNKLSNLRWGTKEENYKDALRNGGVGKNSIQAHKVKLAWATGRYRNRTETRRKLYGGLYQSERV